MAPPLRVLIVDDDAAVRRAYRTMLAPHAEVVVAGSLVITGLATVVPTLPAQRSPEPRVIARLVAE